MSLFSNKRFMYATERKFQKAKIKTTSKVLIYEIFVLEMRNVCERVFKEIERILVFESLKNDGSFTYSLSIFPKREILWKAEYVYYETMAK